MDYTEDLETGRVLASDEAMLLERQSAHDPSNIRLHVQLAAYYGIHEAQSVARIDHLVFLIEHLTESDLWLNPELHISDDELDERSVQMIMNAWLVQTKGKSLNPAVLINAAHYLMFLEPNECARLLELANQIVPDDIDTLYSLAQFYSSEGNYDAEKALKYAESGIQIADTETTNGARLLNYLLTLAGDAAITLGLLDRAEKLGQQLALIDQKYSADQLLGRAALLKGDVDEAEARLSLSTSNLPLIPDIKLANELLAVGKSEGVVAYLEAARQRTTNDSIRETIAHWIRAVASGKAKDLNWQAGR